MARKQLCDHFLGSMRWQVEWPRLFWSVLHVRSLKRPKHAVHNERSGTPLMTRVSVAMFNPFPMHEST